MAPSSLFAATTPEAVLRGEDERWNGILQDMCALYPRINNQGLCESTTIAGSKSSGVSKQKGEMVKTNTIYDRRLSALLRAVTSACDHSMTANDDDAGEVGPSDDSLRPVVLDYHAFIPWAMLRHIATHATSPLPLPDTAEHAEGSASPSLPVCSSIALTDALVAHIIHQLRLIDSSGPSPQAAAPATSPAGSRRELVASVVAALHPVSFDAVVSWLLTRCDGSLSQWRGNDRSPVAADVEAVSNGLSLVSALLTGLGQVLQDSETAAKAAACPVHNPSQGQNRGSGAPLVTPALAMARRLFRSNQFVVRVQRSIEAHLITLSRLIEADDQIPSVASTAEESVGNDTAVSRSVRMIKMLKGALQSAADVQTVAERWSLGSTCGASSGHDVKKEGQAMHSAWPKWVQRRPSELLTSKPLVSHVVEAFHAVDTARLSDEAAARAAPHCPHCTSVMDGDRPHRATLEVLVGDRNTKSATAASPTSSSPSVKTLIGLVTTLLNRFLLANSTVGAMGSKALTKLPLPIAAAHNAAVTIANFTIATQGSASTCGRSSCELGEAVIELRVASLRCATVFCEPLHCESQSEATKTELKPKEMKGSESKPSKSQKQQQQQQQGPKSKQADAVSVVAPSLTVSMAVSLLCRSTLHSILAQEQEQSSHTAAIVPRVLRSVNALLESFNKALHYCHMSNDDVIIAMTEEFAPFSNDLTSLWHVALQDVASTLASENGNQRSEPTLLTNILEEVRVVVGSRGSQVAKRLLSLMFSHPTALPIALLIQPRLSGGSVAGSELFTEAVNQRFDPASCSSALFSAGVSAVETIRKSLTSRGVSFEDLNVSELNVVARAAAATGIVTSSRSTPAFDHSAGAELRTLLHDARHTTVGALPPAIVLTLLETLTAAERDVDEGESSMTGQQFVQLLQEGLSAACFFAGRAAVKKADGWVAVACALVRALESSGSFEAAGQRSGFTVATAAVKALEKVAAKHLRPVVVALAPHVLSESCNQEVRSSDGTDVSVEVVEVWLRAELHRGCSCLTAIAGLQRREVEGAESTTVDGGAATAEVKPQRRRRKAKRTSRHSYANNDEGDDEDGEPTSPTCAHSAVLSAAGFSDLQVRRWLIAICETIAHDALAEVTDDVAAVLSLLVSGQASNAADRESVLKGRVLPLCGRRIALALSRIEQVDQDSVSIESIACDFAAELVRLDPSLEQATAPAVSSSKAKNDDDQVVMKSEAEERRAAIAAEKAAAEERRRAKEEEARRVAAAAQEKIAARKQQAQKPQTSDAKPTAQVSVVGATVVSKGELSSPPIDERSAHQVTAAANGRESDTKVTSKLHELKLAVQQKEGDVTRYLYSVGFSNTEAVRAMQRIKDHSASRADLFMASAKKRHTKKGKSKASSSNGNETDVVAAFEASHGWLLNASHTEIIEFAVTGEAVPVLIDAVRDGAVEAVHESHDDAKAKTEFMDDDFWGSAPAPNALSPTVDSNPGEQTTQFGEKGAGEGKTPGRRHGMRKATAERPLGAGITWHEATGFILDVLDFEDPAVGQPSWPQMIARADAAVLAATRLDFSAHAVVAHAPKDNKDQDTKESDVVGAKPSSASKKKGAKAKLSKQQEDELARRRAVIKAAEEAEAFADRHGVPSGYMRTVCSPEHLELVAAVARYNVGTSGSGSLPSKSSSSASSSEPWINESACTQWDTLVTALEGHGLVCVAPHLRTVFLTKRGHEFHRRYWRPDASFAVRRRRAQAALQVKMEVEEARRESRREQRRKRKAAKKNDEAEDGPAAVVAEGEANETGTELPQPKSKSAKQRKDKSKGADTVVINDDVFTSAAGHDDADDDEGRDSDASSSSDEEAQDNVPDDDDIELCDGGEEDDEEEETVERPYRPRYTMADDDLWLTLGIEEALQKQAQDKWARETTAADVKKKKKGKKKKAPSKPTPAVVEESSSSCEDAAVRTRAAPATTGGGATKNTSLAASKTRKGAVSSAAALKAKDDERGANAAAAKRRQARQVTGLKRHLLSAWFMMKRYVSMLVLLAAVSFGVWIVIDDALNAPKQVAH